MTNASRVPFTVLFMSSALKEDIQVSTAFVEASPLHAVIVGLCFFLRSATPETFLASGCLAATLHAYALYALRGGTFSAAVLQLGSQCDVRALYGDVGDTKWDVALLMGSTVWPMLWGYFFLTLEQMLGLGVAGVGHAVANMLRSADHPLWAVVAALPAGALAGWTCAHARVV